jgi:hypothetical protein
MSWVSPFIPPLSGVLTFFRMKTHQILTANGIPCTVVLDSAVGYIMERVDLVLVGSEAVVESGVGFLTPHWHS